MNEEEFLKEHPSLKEYEHSTDIKGKNLYSEYHIYKTQIDKVKVKEVIELNADMFKSVGDKIKLLEEMGLE